MDDQKPLPSTSKEELKEQIQKMQTHLKSMMDMLGAPKRNDFSVPQKAKPLPSVSKEEEENLKRLKTRENGYNINKYLYVFYRMWSALYILWYFFVLLSLLIIYHDFKVIKTEPKYHFSKILTENFLDTKFKNSDLEMVTFHDISNEDDMWSWMDQVFLPNVASNQLTDPIANTYNNIVKRDGTKPLTIDGLFEVLHPPIMRQTRVRRDIFYYSENAVVKGAEEKKLISKVRVEYFGDRWYKWWCSQIKERSDQGMDQIKRRVTTTSSSSSDKKIVPSN